MLERGTAVGFVASRENEAVGREDSEIMVEFSPPVGAPLAALLAPLAREEAAETVVAADVVVVTVAPVVPDDAGGAGGA